MYGFTWYTQHAPNSAAEHLFSSLCHLVISKTQVQLLEIHDQMSYKKMKFQIFFEVEYYIIKVHRILIIC